MIGKNFSYKGLDFSDGVSGDIVLIDSVKNIPLRTTINDRANFHGTFTSATLASGRLFIFSGQVYGVDKATRDIGWRKLIDVIQPEHNPNDLNRGFYDLTRKTDGGDDMTLKAKVYQAPEASNGLGDPIINFTFALYAESEKTYSPTLRTASGLVGFFGGISLPIPLPTYLAGYAGYIECNNQGNRSAPIKVTVNGPCLNPRIINLTNSNAYKIGTPSDPHSTTYLEYDNRNLDNDPTKLLQVTDAGTSIKEFRSSGGDIFLDPGINHLVVVTDDYPNVSPVTINWRDTYFLT